MRRKLFTACFVAGWVVGEIFGQTPPEPPRVPRPAPCGCIFVCRAHITQHEMDEYYRRENARQNAKVDAINREYYRRTGRKPTPYWEMPY